ncbi:Uncharacterized protein TCM_045783 [Theobroma cacao]|uniref:Uncharacterized protein n=1 Tax=Theobroma cacao TaxID=3641 RepID=S1RW38_THECC|nr:Uncharacterized protein TCM_045783 [Theobroma cacao]
MGGIKTLQARLIPLSLLTTIFVGTHIVIRGWSSTHSQVRSIARIHPYDGTQIHNKAIMPLSFHMSTTYDKSYLLSFNRL